MQKVKNINLSEAVRLFISKEIIHINKTIHKIELNYFMSVVYVVFWTALPIFITFILFLNIASDRIILIFLNTFIFFD